MSTSHSSASSQSQLHDKRTKCLYNTLWLRSRHQFRNHRSKVVHRQGRLSGCEDPVVFLEPRHRDLRDASSFTVDKLEMAATFRAVLDGTAGRWPNGVRALLAVNTGCVVWGVSQNLPRPTAYLKVTKAGPGDPDPPKVTSLSYQPVVCCA